MNEMPQTTKTSRPRWRRWHWVGSVGMLVTAAALWGLFAFVQLLGWREHTEILSGTMPAASFQILAGLAYSVSYFLAVLAAPILAIGSMVYALVATLLGGKKRATHAAQ